MVELMPGVGGNAFLTGPSITLLYSGGVEDMVWINKYLANGDYKDDLEAIKSSDSSNASSIGYRLFPDMLCFNWTSIHFNKSCRGLEHGMKFIPHVIKLK
ncbi:unnamed protein product [Caretta caretta]